MSVGRDDRPDRFDAPVREPAVALGEVGDQVQPVAPEAWVAVLRRLRGDVTMTTFTGAESEQGQTEPALDRAPPDYATEAFQL